MAFRSGDIYATSKGVYNTKKKTFSGKGDAPAGMKKVPEPTLESSPVTTVSPTGKVTTTGFGSKRGASRAKRRAQASRRRVRRIQRSVAPKPETRPERPIPKAPKEYVAPRLSKDGRRTVPGAGHPASKPAKFKGKPTAGAPSLGELRKAQKVGTLKTNREGYVTTPKVRKTAGAIKRIQRKARKRQSNAPLPGLDRGQTKVARTVLRRGEKAKATPKEKLAAIETGLVESTLRNLSYGDRDSEGWRQERSGDPRYHNPTNVAASADRFFLEARTDPGTDTAPTPGLLAQAAQGSAFPEKYDQRQAEAAAIISAYNRGKLKPAERKKLAKARKQARDLGLKAGENLAKGKVPRKVLTRFKAAKQAARELEKAKLPYVWGGGHGDPASRPTSGGLDCSGAVGYVLNKMGAMKGSLVSGEFGQVLEPGPGAVTVFYNPTHVFMRIGKRYWGTSRTNPGGGPGFIEGTPDDLSKYNVGHVPGMGKKVAVQMGIPLTGGGSFPGMTLSESGTTATISGDAATVDEPGFSKRPIRLTQAQKARRKLKRLEELGVGVGGSSEDRTQRSGSTLADLERKYLGAAA